MAPEELQPGAWHKPTLEKIIFSLKFQLPPRTRTACSRRVGGFLTPTGPFFAITRSYTRCCWLGCAECYWKWEPWSPVPAVTPPAPSLRTPSGEQGDGGGWDSCQCGRTRCIPLSCAYFGIFLFFFFKETVVFRNENKRSVAREGEERESPPLALRTHAARSFVLSEILRRCFWGLVETPRCCPMGVCKHPGGYKNAAFPRPSRLSLAEWESQWSRPSWWHRSSQEAEMASVASSLLGW